MVMAAKQFEPDSLDDTALVSSAKEGNTAAFEELIRRHRSRILRVAVRFMSSREDAEDIAQDAFLKAFQHLQHFEERSRFSTWLTRIVANEGLMKLRRARRAAIVSICDGTDEGNYLENRIAERRPDPEQLCSEAQLRNILQEGLTSLPDAYRVVILLRDVEGLSTAETAEVLGLRVTNVKTRLFRARLKLRYHVGKHFERAGTSTNAAPLFNQCVGKRIPACIRSTRPGINSLTVPSAASG